jgi:(p)ppGpp synthase/HD superfamily hydrolase
MSVTAEVREELTSSSPLLAGAYAFASRAHAGQRQDADRSPYIEHALAVARLLHEEGMCDEIVAAGLLHDVVEHSGVRLAQIRRRFGPRVAELVKAMSEPAGVEPFAARKEALLEQVVNSGSDAEAIFMADKVAKAATLRAAVERDGQRTVRRRVGRLLPDKLEHYEAALHLLELQDPQPPFLGRLEDELRRLRRAWAFA